MGPTVRIGAVSVLGVLVFSQMAWASLAMDINEPWWRGQEGSTMAGWEFSTSSVLPPADELHNPYGSAELEVFPITGDEWWPEHEGRTGVWPLSGTVEVDIDNRPEALERKEIWVQLAWRPKVAEARPVVGEVVWEVEGQLVSEEPQANEWVHSTYTITIMPNPSFETVKVSGSIAVDALVIDTWCIPEPTPLVLLALGSLVFVRRRRT